MCTTVPVPVAVGKFMSIHDNCLCNEYVGLNNRVMGKVPPCTGVIHPAARSRLRKHLGRVSRLDYDQAIENYTGRLRSKYQNAAESLKTRPIMKKDSYLQAFVKCEKTDFLAKDNPDPRIIQARNSRYTLELKTYLKPIEERFYSYKSPNGLRAIAKTHNLHDKARLMWRKWQTFTNPVVVSLDCSRWDKHVSLELLKQEHQFYLDAHGGDTHLKMLLDWQLQNVGFSSKGIMYKVRGNRCSGDMNTAIGNCILMSMILESYFEGKNVHWDYCDDGDDCLVFIEQSDEHVLAGLPDHYMKFGHKLKLENRATHFECINFCQAHAIVTADGRKLVRDWASVMTKSLFGTRYYNEPLVLPRLLKQIGLCELAINVGVPILQEFALSLLRQFGHEPDIKVELKLLTSARREMRRLRVQELCEIKPVPISLEHRMSFAQAFGVPVESQLLIEQVLRTQTYPTTGEYDVVGLIDDGTSKVLNACHAGSVYQDVCRNTCSCLAGPSARQAA